MQSGLTPHEIFEIRINMSGGDDLRTADIDTDIGIGIYTKNTGTDLFATCAFVFLQLLSHCCFLQKSKNLRPPAATRVTITSTGTAVSEILTGIIYIC
jgi:hypothetical protein